MPNSSYKFDPLDWVNSDRYKNPSKRISSMMGKYNSLGLLSSEWEKMVEKFLPFAITPSVFDRFGFEPKNWCNKNLKHYWTDSVMIGVNNGFNVFRFQDFEEALFFKLMWAFE